MRTIASLSMLLLGFFSSWQMLLFWAAVYLLVFGFWDQRRMKLVLRNLLLLLLCFVNYTLFQCTVGYTSKNPVTETMIHLVECYARLPALWLWGICMLLTATEAFLIWSMYRWRNTHITSASIKEAIETLPVGICAFETNGKITLRNKTMEQLCRSLTGMPLLNGNEFVKLLEEMKPDLSEFIVSMPEHGVWTLTKEEIRDGCSSFSLLIAYNVTEAYEKTHLLDKRQKTVQELNRKLIDYNRQIVQVTTQQEILNAKVHIHDELGSGLLAIKHCLVNHGSDEERRNLMERLKENIRFLQQEVIPEQQDEYALILQTAEELGVSVQISGILPQTEPYKHTIATAIHECFTNILRHTDGSTLFVSITEDDDNIKAQFTDNNTGCVGEITPTGGLRSLRALTEQIGGKLQILTVPRYSLMIIIPKEAEKYGLSCFDRR